MAGYTAKVRNAKTQEAVRLRAKQWGYLAIGAEIGVSYNTARTWVEDEHARRAEHRGPDREAHLAVYEAIQLAAWEAFGQTDRGSLNRSGYLNTIKAAEDSKTKITGAEAPVKYQDVGEPYEIFFEDEATSEAES